MLRNLLRRFRHDTATDTLYAAIVAQARQPSFYSDLAVPDTLDGRFDMLVVHLVLVMRRLHREGEGGRDTAQALFDAFFVDMDRSLREMGVGDLVVPKRIRRMAEAFYGRAAAYDAALDADDPAALTAAVEKNVYAAAAEPAARSGAAALLADYVRRAEAALATKSADAMMAGAAWPPVAAPAPSVEVEAQP